MDTITTTFAISSTIFKVVLLALAEIVGAHLDLTTTTKIFRWPIGPLRSPLFNRTSKSEAVILMNQAVAAWVIPYY